MYDLSIPGFMNERDLMLISEFSSEVPEHGVIVEVGSFKGRSAVAWAASCHPSVTVYCVDPFKNIVEDFYEEFKRNTEKYTNIVPIIGYSPELIHYPGDLIDVFFLDAAHINPNDKNNIEYFKRFMKPNGLICGHDYGDEWKDVIRNVRWLEQELNQPVTLYPDSTIWSFKLGVIE